MTPSSAVIKLAEKDRERGGERERERERGFPVSLFLSLCGALISPMQQEQRQSEWSDSAICHTLVSSSLFAASSTSDRSQSGFAGVEISSIASFAVKKGYPTTSGSYQNLSA